MTSSYTPDTINPHLFAQLIVATNFGFDVNSYRSGSILVRSGTNKTAKLARLILTSTMSRFPTGHLSLRLLNMTCSIP